MDVLAFTSSARGEVRRTLQGYHAFHPAPLPRTLELPVATVTLLAAATASLYKLGGVGRLLPNPDLLILPYIRAEAVLSSRIEGTESTISDILKVQAGDTGHVPRQDIREVQNYMAAMEHGLRRLREGLPLCLRLVREMQQVLLAGVRGQRKKTGEFRDDQNWIGRPDCPIEDATFVPPPVDSMHEALNDWERFLHDANMPLLGQLALAHYQFEAIHPFFDGNGRIGRLLISLMLVAREALPQPLLYLSVYFERHRTAYYRSLLEVSQSGDPMPWLEFFLRAVRVQSIDAEERAVRLVDAQQALRSRLLAEQAPASVQVLAEHLFVDPYATTTSAMRVTGTTRPTGQKAIDALVDLGVLREVTGQKRNRFYFAEEIYAAIYGDLEVSEGRDNEVDEVNEVTVADRRLDP